MDEENGQCPCAILYNGISLITFLGGFNLISAAKIRLKCETRLVCNQLKSLEEPT